MPGSVRQRRRHAWAALQRQTPCDVYEPVWPCWTGGTNVQDPYCPAARQDSGAPHIQHCGYKNPKRAEGWIKICAKYRIGDTMHGHGHGHGHGEHCPTCGLPSPTPGGYSAGQTSRMRRAVARRRPVPASAGVNACVNKYMSMGYGQAEAKKLCMGSGAGLGAQFSQLPHIPVTVDRNGMAMTPAGMGDGDMFIATGGPVPAMMICCGNQCCTVGSGNCKGFLWNCIKEKITKGGAKGGAAGTGGFADPRAAQNAGIRGSRFMAHDYETVYDPQRRPW